MTDHLDDDERDERDEAPAGVDGVDSVDEDGHDWRDEYLDDQLAEHDAHGIVPGTNPMSRFRHGSLGVTLGAAMVGLGNVLEPRKKEEAEIIVEHDRPDDNDRLVMHLDPDNPSNSVIIIRPWLDDHHHDHG